MKHAKFLLLALVVLLALGSFSAAMAQDTMAAMDLTMWSSDLQEDNDVLSGLFTKWAETYAPGSTLDLQYKETETLRNDILTAGLAGSGLPDMILGPNDNIGPFVTSGLIQPLDDMFDMSKYPTVLAAGQLDGVTYGLPITSGNHLMLMYNKTFVPTPPDTWDELVTMAQQIMKDNPDVMGLAFNQPEPFWLVPVVFGYGGTVWNADHTNYTIDTQPWIDALTFFHKLKFDDKITPTECDYNCTDSLFKEGGAAMILNGDWAINDYLNTEVSPALGADNLGLAPWPKLENGERPKPYTSGKFISIPVGVEGDKLAEVVAFLTWLTTDPDAVTALTIDTGRLPATEGITVDPEKYPILAESLVALQSGVGMPAEGLRCMWDSVRPNMQAVYSDTMTPADAAAESQTAAEDCLASS